VSSTYILIHSYSVYNYCRGEVATCHTSLCEAQALATVLRLHEEEVSILFQSWLLRSRFSSRRHIRTSVRALKRLVLWSIN
jgi:S-adenosylmethionine/arginine decarboxylase-like enzyme